MSTDEVNRVAIVDEIEVLEALIPAEELTFTHSSDIKCEIVLHILPTISSDQVFTYGSKSVNFLPRLSIRLQLDPSTYPSTLPPAITVEGYWSELEPHILNSLEGLFNTDAPVIYDLYLFCKSDLFCPSDSLSDIMFPEGAKLKEKTCLEEELF